jgi:hypothetical protein
MDTGDKSERSLTYEQPTTPSDSSSAPRHTSPAAPNESEKNMSATDNRYKVLLLSDSGVWELQRKSFSETNMREFYGDKKKEVKGNKQGGVRLVSPSGAILSQFVYGDEESVTMEQPTLF